MKIVKEFEDKEYFRRNYGSENGYWSWGLGDDGEVYFKSSLAGTPGTWYGLHTVVASHYIIRLNDMKRIVKQFGHLVVFT